MRRWATFEGVASEGHVERDVLPSGFEPPRLHASCACRPGASREAQMQLLRLLQSLQGSHYVPRENTHRGEALRVPSVLERISQKFSLDRHLVAIHKGQRNFACSVCGGAFSSKDSLDRHSKEVHEEQRNFACSICSTGRTI
ncbi:zinc finger protein 467-like [Ornithodoros turicata]|uniref:zinc finger protein 467-like n=1 Tax=Ornithodoros turicata TaxID=34597 RepID=UPI003138ABF4